MLIGCQLPCISCFSRNRNPPAFRDTRILFKTFVLESLSTVSRFSFTNDAVRCTYAFGHCADHTSLSPSSTTESVASSCCNLLTIIHIASPMRGIGDCSCAILNIVVHCMSSFSIMDLRFLKTCTNIGAMTSRQSLDRSTCNSCAPSAGWAHSAEGLGATFSYKVCKGCSDDFRRFFCGVSFESNGNFFRSHFRVSSSAALVLFLPTPFLRNIPDHLSCR